MSVIEEGEDGLQLLTSKQAAERLGVSEYTVNEYIRKGLLGYVELHGRQRRIRLDQIHAFVQARTVQAGQ